MQMKHILLVFLCLLVALGAVAQVKITGKVIDDAGKPIEFATVRIVGTTIGVNTNDKGFYELNVPKSDTIRVEFTCLGYSTVTRELIKPEGTVTLNPKLYEKTQELNEVTITEYKKQTNAMQGLDLSQTSITPTASGNAVENVLTTMAGVSSKNEMSSQYMVRGGSYDENSVYINGIEVYRPATHQQWSTRGSEHYQWRHGAECGILDRWFQCRVWRQDVVGA